MVNEDEFGRFLAHSDAHLRNVVRTGVKNENEETGKIDSASPKVIGNTCGQPSAFGRGGNPVTHALCGDRPFGFGKVFAAHRDLCEEPRCLSTIYPVGRLRTVEWFISHVGVDGQLVVGKVFIARVSKVEQYPFHYLP